MCDDYSFEEFRAAYELTVSEAWRLFEEHGPDRLALDLAMVVDASLHLPAPHEIPVSLGLAERMY